ncbi:MAG: WD40 repeat domain-containing protein [bacterium]
MKVAALLTIFALAGAPHLSAQEPRNLPDFFFAGVPFGITSMAFSPNGRHLAVGLMGDLGPGQLSNPMDVLRTDRPGKVQVWDMPSRQSRWVLTGHTGSVATVTFSPDGRTIASSGADDSIRFWDVGTGRSTHTAAVPPGVSALAYSPDGQLLAGLMVNGPVALWDTRTGSLRRMLKGSTELSHGMAFSPDGRSVAAGSWDRIVRLWDVGSGRLIRRFEGHTKQVVPVVFSPDGRRLASGSNDATIRLWDVRTGRTVRVLQARSDIDSDPILDLAYSPDGRVLAAAFANRARLWDPETGQTLRDLDAHTTPVTSVAISPDGRLIATGSFDEYVRFWYIRSP